MLSLMRTHATGWFIKILLGAIVVVFIFWGAGSFRAKNLNSVAVVNGKPISIEEYKEAYDNVIEDMRRRFGKDLDQKMLKMLNIEKQTVMSLIDKKILLNEANKLNIKITDDELSDSIKNTEAFRNDKGSFDFEIYKRVLSINRTNEERFEAERRKDMLIQKLIAFVTANAKVSENEARKWYDWQNVSVNMKFIFFDPLTYNDVSPSDNETRDYFQTHSKDYETKEKVKTQYCTFKISDYEKDVNISEEEIKNYYDSNIENYKIPEQVEARHILLKLDNNADDKKVKEREKEAYDIMQKAKKGEDFASLAVKFSEDPSASNGGYLGIFTKDMIVKPFGDVAFSLKEQEISEPVRTVFGWHIIKVEKINNESIKQLSEVEGDIKTKLTSEKAKLLAFGAAEEFRKSLSQGDDLEKVSKEKGIPIFATDFFTADSAPEHIQNKDQFAGAAFALEGTEISDIIEAKDEYMVVRATDRILPEIPAFENIKDKVTDDLKAIIQKDKAKKDAQDALKVLKEGSTIEDIAQKYKINLNITGYFRKNAQVKDIGYDRNVAEAAFKMNPEKPQDLAAGEKGWYLLKLIDKKFPENDEYEKNREKTIEELKEAKRQELYWQWLTELRNNSEITIGKNFMGS